MAGKKIEELLAPPTMGSRTSLAEAYPEIARMWSKKRNCGYGPEEFSFNSNVVAWFECKECRSALQRPINVMVKSWRNGYPCSLCSTFRADRGNRLVDRFPELAKEYCTKRNEFPVEKLAYGSSRTAWWVCGRCEFVWRTLISNRTQRKTGCPNCVRSELIDLKETSYYKYFDKKANKGIDPLRFPVVKEVWWKCGAGPDHRWRQKLPNQIERPERGKRFCPFCRGSRASISNNLSLYKDIAREFDREANGGLRPRDVSATSQADVWWKCSCGPDHRWQARVVERTFKGAGCPFCANRRLSQTNSLERVAPQLAKMWHPTKNGGLRPADVVAYTTKKAWFVCARGHEYEVMVHRAVVGRGCTRCK
jgi:Probable Zinc-ribbon domain